MKNTSPKHKNTMRFTAIVVLVCLTLASLTTFIFLKSHVNNQALAVVNLQTKHIKAHIQSSIQSEAEALTRISKLLETNENMSRSTFAEHAKVYLQHQDNIEAISFIDVSNTIQWVIPDTLTTQLVELQAVIDNTHRLNQQKLSSTLVSDPIALNNNEVVIELCAPIYIEGNFHGCVTGLMDFSGALKKFGQYGSIRYYGIQIVSKKLPVYQQNMASKKEYQHWIQSASIQYGSDTWVLHVWPSKASLEEAHIYYNIPYVALMVGLFLSLLISGMLYLFGAVKRQNKEIASKGSALQLIHEITAIIRQDISFNEILERSINSICLETDWPIGHAYLPSTDNSNKLIASNIWYQENSLDLTEFKKTTSNTMFEKGVGLPGRIWETQKPAWIYDISKDNNFPRAKHCSALQIHSAIGFAIFIDDKILAVLEFFTNKKLKKDTKLLKTFSTLSSQLEQAWKKRLIEQQIEKSREQNEMLLQAAGEGIYGIDLEGKTTFVNPAAAKMLGYTEEELISQPMHPLIHHSNPDGTPYPQENCPIYAAAHDGTVHETENEVFWRKDGTSFPIRYTSTPIHDSGRLVGAVISFSDITQKVEENNKLKGMAQNDYLTNLYNRFHFEQALLETISHADRASTHFAILYLDLDGFKTCNDTLGHKSDDMVLIQVAERLKTLIRGHDIIARIGGDEFAIILLDIENESDVRATASRITKILGEEYSCLGNVIKVGVSIGVASYPTDSRKASELTEFAGKALYAAKNSGRNQYKLYNELSL